MRKLSPHRYPLMNKEEAFDFIVNGLQFEKELYDCSIIGDIIFVKRGKNLKNYIMIRKEKYQLGIDRTTTKNSKKIGRITLQEIIEKLDDANLYKQQRRDQEHKRNANRVSKESVSESTS